MLVNTKPYGQIEVDERQRIRFPFGILGFEKLEEYVLLDATQQPFYWLQSVDRSEVAFVLMDPKVVRPDYTLDVPSSEMQEIGAADENEILVFAIVTIPEEQARMSANLQGPVLINRLTRIGRQSISLNPKWRVRHYILDELARVGEEAC